MLTNTKIPKVTSSQIHKDKLSQIRIFAVARFVGHVWSNCSGRRPRLHWWRLSCTTARHPHSTLDCTSHTLQEVLLFTHSTHFFIAIYGTLHILSCTTARHPHSTLQRNRSHIVAWVRRAGLLLCWRRQLHSSRTSWEKSNLGNRLRNKAKSEKGGEGGYKGLDWIQISRAGCLKRPNPSW